VTFMLPQRLCAMTLRLAASACDDLSYNGRVCRRSRGQWFAFAALLWLASFACSGHVAAQGNDLGAPAGGRATLMGNTGVALGRDGSAPFYNPATIVRIRDESLAFSVNFYSLMLANFPAWHAPGELDAERFGDKDRNGTNLWDVDFRPLPSTLCLFFTLEELVSSIAADPAADAADAAGSRDSGKGPPTGKKLALCFATLESEEFDVQAIKFRSETRAGASSQVQSLLRRWSRTYVGPTYSISLSRNFAIGGSLQAVYSWDSFGIHSESLSAQLGGGGVTSTISTGGSGKSFELTGTFGATYRVGRVTFGASLRLPSLHVWGEYDGTFSQTYSSGEDTSSTLADGRGNFTSAPPMRLALGAGIAADRVTLELDVAFQLPLQRQLSTELIMTKSTLTPDGVERTSGPEKYEITGRPVINPSFGLEYFISSGLSLLTGVSANFSSLDPLQPVRSVGNIALARINHIGGSLGIGSYWQGGELLFGLAFDYGFGRMVAVNPFVVPNTWSIVDVNTYTLLFVVAGSTSLNSIVRMVNAITHGGEVEPVKPVAPAVQDPAAPPRPAAESVKIELPINPDAREAEGVEEVAPETVPEPDNKESGGASRGPADAGDAGTAGAAAEP
jgi:hypothetical protein